MGHGGVEQDRVWEMGDAFCTQDRGFQLCCKCNKELLEFYAEEDMIWSMFLKDRLLLYGVWKDGEPSGSREVN